MVVVAFLVALVALTLFAVATFNEPVRVKLMAAGLAFLTGALILEAWVRHHPHAH